MPNVNKCTKQGKSCYRMTITLGRQLNADGKVVQKRKDFYGKTKTEVERKYQEYQKKRNLNLDTSKRYFGIEADRWIKDYLTLDTSLKDTTKGLYIETWNRYVKPSDLYYRCIDNVDATDIQELYNKLFKGGCPTSAIKTINKVMTRFYRFMVLKNYTPRVLTDSITIPSKRIECDKEIIIWTDEEYSAIFNGFEKAQDGFRLRFLLVMARYTGMRISELLGLKYEDIKRTKDGYLVNVRRQVQSVPHYDSNGTKHILLEESSLKSSSSYRTIPLEVKAVEEFKRHRKWHLEEQMLKGYRTDFIFTTDTGGLIDKRNAERSCRRYYERIGVEPKGFHTYRHTFGTNLCQKGVSLKNASKLLGHKSIEITAKFYVGSPMDDLRSAIQVLYNAI